MGNLKTYVVAAFMVLAVQACSVESNSHLKVPHSGWYQDPMNPKYAMKKNYEHKSASSDSKHKNLLKQ